MLALWLVACTASPPNPPSAPPEGMTAVVVRNARANPVTLDTDMSALTPFLAIRGDGAPFPLHTVEYGPQWSATCDRTCGVARSRCAKPVARPVEIPAFGEQAFSWGGELREFVSDQGCFRITPATAGAWTLEVYAHPDFRTHPLASATIHLPSEHLEIVIPPDLDRAWAAAETVGTAALARVAEHEVGPPPPAWSVALSGASFQGKNWRFDATPAAETPLERAEGRWRVGEGPWHPEACPVSQAELTHSGSHTIVWESSADCVGITAIKTEDGTSVWTFTTGAGG